MAQKRSTSPDCSSDDHRPLLPLNSLCPGGAATGGERTNTGRRCALHSCLEIAPGLHYSHSNFCPIHFNSHGFPVSFDISTVITAAPSRGWANSSEVFTMPRLRQRMACRKGASRGRSLGERPPLSHHVDRPLEPTARRPALSSSDPPGPRPDFFDMAPPRSDPPPLAPPLLPPQPFVAASSPSPSGSFLRQSTQHTELRFDRAFDHPFSVFLTVTLSEELPFPPASRPSLLQPPSAPAFAPPSVPNPAPLIPSSCAPSVPIPSSSGHFNLQMDAGLTEDEENKANDGDQDDQYGCRIMEEHSASD